MRSCFRTLVRLSVALCLVLPGPVRADQEEAPTEDQGEDLDNELDDEFALLEEEDEVVFSAARHAQPISDSPSTITVITREQIENTHCLTVPCLLRQVPELEVRDVRPMFQSVGARALTSELSDKGLVLIDGWEINVDAFGLPYWGALPVHLNDIERIEVIRGPGSALYGANAHSMVISITTRRPERDGAEVFVGGGELDTSSLNLRTDLVRDGWRASLTGGLETTGHWRIPGRREREVFRARLTLDKDWGGSESRIDLGLVTGKGILYTELAPADLTNSFLLHAIATHKLKELQARVWFSLFKTDLSFDLPLVIDIAGSRTPLGTFPKVLDIFAPSLDSELQWSHSFFEGNLLMVGGNYRWLSYSCEQNLVETTHQHRLGAYLQDEQRLWDRLLLNLGLRFDYNNITPWTISPRGALVWKIIPTQVLRISAGQAFRKPAFFHTSVHITSVEGSGVTPRLGDFFARSIGNDDLGNERLTAFELGYRGRFFGDVLTVELDSFFNQYTDTIHFLFDMQYNSLGFPDLSRSQLQFVNQDSDIDCLGGSIAATFRWQEWLRISANYTYRYTWYPDGPPLGTLVAADKAADRYHGEPAQLANLTAQASSAMGLRGGLAVYYRSAFDLPEVADGSLFGERVIEHMPAAVTFSANLSWRLSWDMGWLEAGLRVSNLFNQGVADTTRSVRYDGVEMGGQLMGRRAAVYLRGAL